MKILVTGGAGFIGSHLVDSLIRDGHQVLVVDDLSFGKKEYINPKADFVLADITDLESIKTHFSGIDVFHANCRTSDLYQDYFQKRKNICVPDWCVLMDLHRTFHFGHSTKRVTGCHLFDCGIDGIRYQRSWFSSSHDVWGCC